MNTKEARIAAHVCGDGWLTKYLEKNALHIVHGKRYRQNRIRYVIGYCNTKNELLREFEKDMIAQFNIKPVKVRSELRFKSKRVFDRIKQLGGGNSREWFIGKEILNSNKKIKIEWLRAFFDDECTFDSFSNRIRIKCMNLNGLKQIRGLLLGLKIPSNITGQNIDKSFYLNIRSKDVQRCNKYIKLKHKLKRGKILRFLR